MLHKLIRPQIDTFLNLFMSFMQLVRSNILGKVCSVPTLIFSINIEHEVLVKNFHSERKI
jgi:hypothetical protein